MHRRKTTFILGGCLISLLGPWTALGQTTGTVPGSPHWFFETIAPNPPADMRTSAGQRHAAALAAVGREDLLGAIDGRLSTLGSCTPGSTDENVIARLAALADETTIVIVNEAHDTPKHRELTRQLAIALRERNFTNFAAEAFSPAIERSADPFARSDAGYDANEPTFGSLIRTVKALGYELIAYEQTDAQRAPAGADVATTIEAREEAQTENLLARIFAADPQAKTLVHVGHSHAAEVPLANFDTSIAWFAARVKARTGVDPLTIDQTNCTSSADVIELAAPTQQLPPGAFDIAVAHPETTFFRGRPQWRIDAGAIAVELPEQLVDEKRRSLVEARYAGEPPDAIPVERLLLRPGERLPLLLPAGSLRLTQYFEDGAAPRSLVLNVQ